MVLSRTLRRWRLWWHVLGHHRLPDRQVLAGHHHRNVVVALREPLASIVDMAAGELVTLRTPVRTLDVVLRLWDDEAAVVRTVQRHLPETPRILESLQRRSLYTFVVGTPLARRCPPGRPVGEANLRRIAQIFGRLATVPRDDLPAVPPESAWPADGDSVGFLTRLATHAEEKIHQLNRPRFGQLFDDLRIPRDAVERFRVHAKSLQPRPFGLLHTDIHRSNLVLAERGDLCLVDWELALFGDPLHDLATHLVRMRYTPAERRRMVRLWREEMRGRGHPDRLAGMADTERASDDLGVYVDFEYAQSVHADTMRAALSLPRHPGDRDYRRIAAAVRGTLCRARRSLELPDVPRAADVNEALRAWRARQRPVSLRLDAVRRPVVRR